ncbi:hypothetical protein Pla123a_05820 [Posidoniimonas polymericola]|uniref:VWFA domain-containing protein n=1 Tax=Posidoniimonas polymericola TaxID=2528002 RepID=A0A5C5ZF94_9BACT|nr:hypothetical protein [Posidoniimonas polymericola]TWT85775.1 hypothetical protein Pla123a_05820 [Posidoniimonas polymericola]
MPTNANRQPDPAHRQWPAWAISVLTHSLAVTAVLVIAGGRHRGATEQTTARAGIVLRKFEDATTSYHGEDDAPQPSSNADQPTLDAAAGDAAEREVAMAELASHLPPRDAGPAASGEVLGVTPGGGPSGGGDALPGRTIGGGATVSVFGVEGTGHKFVYAFDRSVSMTGAPLAAAKAQLLASLSALGSTNQFQIVFFNHRLKAFDLTGGGARITFANERTLAAAQAFVESIGADGGTDRFLALRHALRMEPDVVFFLTDADDAMTGGELQQIARLNERVGATVCTIEFGRGPERGGDNFLKRLSRMTGGQHGYVDTTRLTRN